MERELMKNGVERRKDMMAESEPRREQYVCTIIFQRMRQKR